MTPSLDSLDKRKSLMSRFTLLVMGREFALTRAVALRMLKHACPRGLEVITHQRGWVCYCLGHTPELQHPVFLRVQSRLKGS